MIYDLIIIGGGSAGMSAGIYGKRYGLKTLIISKEVGGSLNEAQIVENYPGIKSISGLELMFKFKEHVDSLGVEFIEDIVVKAEKKDDRFVVYTANKKYEARALILALGLQRRRLNVLGEEKFVGKGVSYCYTCDAPLFKDKIVAVVGGSDSATTAALLISKYAKKTYIIHRGDKLRAAPINVKAVEQDKNIEVIYNTNVIELRGNGFLKEAILDKPYKGKKEFKIDGLFVEIGLVPSTAIAESLGIMLDESNFIVVDNYKRTNVKGVFAAGDITNTVLRQNITAAADGAIAAKSAYEYIKEKELNN
ncbi:MAG: FAD-dependent oxidoreductase [Candidatus Woesearchaeota archaeon]|nr:FAD-dependent oxidoreductase [Candidatus Woesearchaeota archaeon]